MVPPRALASEQVLACVSACVRMRAHARATHPRSSVRPSGRAGGRALVRAHACTCTASSRLGSRGSVTASAGLGSEAQLVQGWGARDRPAPMSKTANRPAEDCAADQPTAWRRAMVGVRQSTIGVTGASSVQWSALPTALLSHWPPVCMAMPSVEKGGGGRPAWLKGGGGGPPWLKATTVLSWCRARLHLCLNPFGLLRCSTSYFCKTLS